MQNHLKKTVDTLEKFIDILVKRIKDSDTMLKSSFVMLSKCQTLKPEDIDSYKILCQSFIKQSPIEIVRAKDNEGPDITIVYTNGKEHRVDNEFRLSESEEIANVLDEEEDLRSEMAREDDEMQERISKPLPVKIETWAEATDQVNQILVRLKAINTLQVADGETMESFQTQLDEQSTKLRRMESIEKSILEIPSSIMNDISDITKKIFKKRSGKMRDELLGAITELRVNLENTASHNDLKIQENINTLVDNSNEHDATIIKLQYEIELLKNKKKYKRYIKKTKKKGKRE